jgi:hypothetical protein
VDSGRRPVEDLVRLRRYGCGEGRVLSTVAGILYPALSDPQVLVTRGRLSDRGLGL